MLKATAQATKGANKREVLHYYLDRISKLGKPAAPLGHLTQLIYVILALEHHERLGGLPPEQLKVLVSLARGVAKALRKPIFGSEISPLFVEFHLLLSRIRTREGKFWPAAMEHSFAETINLRSRIGANAHAVLLRAQLAERRGHVGLVQSMIAEAQSLGLTPADKQVSILMRLRLARYARRHDEAESYAAECLADAKLDDSLRLEIEWEALCRAAQREGDYGPLISAVSSEGRHRSARFMFELAFWLRGAPEKKWQSKASKYENIRKAADERIGKPHPEAEYYDASRKFDALYESERPHEVRMRILRGVLSKAPRLPSSAAESTVWIAAARWLKRSNEPNLAALALAEYSEWSQRLSGGVTRDVFALAKDLIT